MRGGYMVGGLGVKGSMGVGREGVWARVARRP